MPDEGLTAAARAAAEWIRAIAVGQDRAAFASLFEFYAPRIKAMLMRSGAAADAAEDVAQEALLTVWRKASYFDPARASASAWIFTIARNLRIDRLRGDKRGRTARLERRKSPIAPEVTDAALLPPSAMNGCVRARTFVRRNKFAWCSFRSSKAAPTAISRAARSAAWHRQIAVASCHDTAAQSAR